MGPAIVCLNPRSPSHIKSHQAKGTIQVPAGNLAPDMHAAPFGMSLSARLLCLRNSESSIYSGALTLTCFTRNLSSKFRYHGRDKMCSVKQISSCPGTEAQFRGHRHLQAFHHEFPPGTAIKLPICLAKLHNYKRCALFPCS